MLNDWLTIQLAYYVERHVWASHNEMQFRSISFFFIVWGFSMNYYCSPICKSVFFLNTQLSSGCQNTSTAFRWISIIHLNLYSIIYFMNHALNCRSEQKIKLKFKIFCSQIKIQIEWNRQQNKIRKHEKNDEYCLRRG